MRLLLNEMWSAEIARQLRRRGHDVVAATEAGTRYRGQPDEIVFERAREDRRAIVTDNVADYAVLVADAASRGIPHLGVVFALRPSFDRSRRGVVGAMTSSLSALLEADEPIHGARFLRP